MFAAALDAAAQKFPERNYQTYMYQIHKWEKKAHQLFKNLRSPCYDLTCTVTYSVHARILGERKKKMTLAYPNPLFSSGTTRRVWIWFQLKNLSRVKQMHIQW